MIRVIFKIFSREILLQKLPTHRPTKSPTRPDPTRLSKSRFSESPTRPDFQYRWSVPTLGHRIIPRLRRKPGQKIFESALNLTMNKHLINDIRYIELRKVKLLSSSAAFLDRNNFLGQ